MTISAAYIDRNACQMVLFFPKNFHIFFQMKCAFPIKNQALNFLKLFKIIFPKFQLFCSKT